MTQAEFSRHLGVERSYVTALKQSGRLVMTDDGKVDVEASEAKIAATADPGKAGVAERHAKNRGDQPADGGGGKPADQEADDAGSEADETPDYQRARARKELANAQLAEMEVAKQAGLLFESTEVLAVVADAGTIFRTTLESRRPLLVSQLAVMNDEAQIRLFLEEQDEHLLADLAARFGAIGRAE